MKDWVRHLPWLVSLVVLAFAVGAQLHTRRSEDEFLLAPVGYVLGVVFVLMPPQLVLIALAMGGVCFVAFRSLAAFFFFFAITTGALGYMIMKMNPWAAVSVVLLMQPCLLALMMGRRLAVPMLVRTVGKRRRELREVGRFVPDLDARRGEKA